MSKGDNSPGISKLAGVMKGIAKGEQSTALTLDLGIIQPDKSLLTDTYPIPIPRSDYLVCRSLKERTGSFNTSTVSGHSHTGSVTTKEALAVGDRVLVAWVQDDAVVVDVILEASEVF